MGISIFPTAAASGSDNFELISSVTPTAGTTSVNFTSFAVYKKLLLVYQDIALSTNGVIRTRINNDSDSNYWNGYFSWASVSTTINTQVTSGFFNGVGMLHIQL